jgi:hypothetical protein
MIRSNSYMEMLLMFSCSKDNAIKWPITGSCEEREIPIRSTMSGTSNCLHVIITNSYCYSLKFPLFPYFITYILTT